MLLAVESSHVERGVLMNLHRSVAAIGRCDQPQMPLLLGVGEMLLFIARRDSRHFGLDPDLQEMQPLRLRRIELAVPDARSRAHPLYVAGANHRAVAERVLVREFTREHIA